MDKFSFLIAEGFKNIFRHKLTSFATIFSVFLTLSIVGFLILANQNTNKIIEYLRAKYKIEVFFKEGFTCPHRYRPHVINKFMLHTQRILPLADKENAKLWKGGSFCNLCL